MLDTLFGPPDQWPRQDLIGFSEEFDPGTALMAYRCGVFPMPLAEGLFDGEMGWWSPMERAQLPLDEVRITRSLRQSAKRYTTTVDTAFLEVLDACADPSRPGGWIDQRIQTAFTALHHVGYVHSVETWDSEGRLVGGLYGVHQNGMFAGESMFHDPRRGRDASKVALLRLVAELRRIGVELLDVQWLTPHLESMGAHTVPRDSYLGWLGEHLAKPHNNAWSAPEKSRMSGTALLSMMEDG
ncbi:MAG: leucyl/phenylalanyl-tRNA--protein transferase [Propionibacteriaceae bacterium]|nr:leucyl/phenylalanyl-tRNA--protein transferase [Propionibacteriaceae bacterium]